MIEVKSTITETLNDRINRLRLLAQNDPKVFKTILQLVILDDMYDWSLYLDDSADIQNFLKNLRIEFINRCKIFKVQNKVKQNIIYPRTHEQRSFYIASDDINSYVNVNTEQTSETWNRFWDNKDVVTLNSDNIIEYLNITDLDEINNTEGRNYLYVDKDGYVMISETNINLNDYITQ